MSMLAERKRKQKWSLNPRGKEWSEDANKFGQKLLERMGWQHGKGLGAKENGITEHVKVSYKNDSKGMGYKESNDQWTEHESNFTALLESLTGKENGLEEKKVTSLEQKSQISRARVHYHKFTRGKDLSRASEKDLANIFGKKSLKDSKKPDVALKTEDDDSKETENNSGFLVNAGSMKDYFKKKLLNFGKTNGCVIGNNGVLRKEESDSESEPKPSFGFGFNSSNNIELNAKHEPFLINKEESESESEVRQSFGLGFNNKSDTSLKKPKSNFVSYIAEDTKRKAEEHVDEVFSPKKKSKKEKLKTEPSLGVSNPCFNPMATPLKIKKHLLEPIEESVTEDSLNISTESVNKKCKQKKLLNGSVVESNYYENGIKKKKCKNTDYSLEDISINVNSFDISPTKSKKNKKKKESTENTRKEITQNMEIDNPIFNEIEDTSVISSQIEENPYEITKKLKKMKKSSKEKSKSIEIDNPNFDDIEDISINVSQIDENPYEVKIKKNKKHKKVEVDNPNFDESEDIEMETSIIEDNPYEIKPKEKKKKKNKNLAIDNPSFLDQEEKLVDSINPYEVKLKKITKKEIIDPGIANPSLDLNDSKNEESTILEDFDLMLNVVSTPIVVKEDTRKSVGTVTKVENLRNRKSVRFSNITQELIIPNNEELKEMCTKDDKKKKKMKKGLDNLNFDKQRNNLDENVDTISKTIDNFQAEIENDMNEEKINTLTLEDIMVGEVGNPHGTNEKVPEGIKLKFKYANMHGKTPFYQLDKIGAKKSYKHLIKGDIIVKFKHSNLHEIKGYANKNKNKT